MKTELKKLKNSEVEINFELDEKEFEEYLQKALEHLKEHVKVDGFRKGNVPKEMVEKRVGQENVLMEAGDLAVKKTYSKFVVDNKLEPIGDPDVQIVKIAKGNPFLFKVIVAVLPEVELPDYKEIVASVKVGKVEVDEKEIEEAIVYLQKSRAIFTDKTTGAEKKDYVKIEYQNEHIGGGKPVKDMFILGEAGFLPDFEDNLLGMKPGDEKEFTAKFPANTPNEMGSDASEAGSAGSPVSGKEGTFKVKMVAIQVMALPGINDEFAKQLGAFDTLVALKENLKTGISLEKGENERMRARGEMVSKIAEKIKFELPEKMVAYEQERLLEDMKNQIASQFKISFEEYLASVKKTEEEIKSSFKLEAEKRIKNFLVLRQIGKVETIEVSAPELEEEMNKVSKRYSKEQLEKIDINELREYSKGAIFNEKVFNFLETFSPK
ncbi:MAG: trigger factor [Candidatus Staskawiczbacteria bacterium]|nr:trigger factor [Candidatus Staskawiczbacteria bacterium]